MHLVREGGLGAQRNGGPGSLSSLFKKNVEVFLGARSGPPPLPRPRAENHLSSAKEKLLVHKVIKYDGAPGEETAQQSPRL